MPAALPHTGRISQDFTKEVEFDTREVQFGNGYKEIAPKGINDKTEKWRLNYESMTAAEYGDLMTALNTVKKNDYLTWTPFGEVSSKNWSVVGSRTERYKNGMWDVSIGLETYR